MELHNESSKKKALKWKSAADTPLSKKLKLGEMSDESDDDIHELWDEETSEAESDEEEEDDDDEDFSEEEKQKVLSTPKKHLKASKSESALKKDYSSERKLNKSASERQFSETPSTAKSKVTSLSEKKNKPKDESNPDSNSSQNGEPSQTEPGKKKKKKKKKNAEGSEDVAQQTHSQTPSQTPSQKVPVKKVLSGGTIMEEVKIGHGPEAKEGKVVHVYYAGNLLNNGKRFDSKLRGQPFKFRLGKRSYSGLGCWYESWWKTKINSSSKSRIRQTGTHSSQQHSCV